jgi:hypothetical protein
MAVKYLHDISLETNELKNFVVDNLTANPTAKQGRVYYHTTSNELRISDGSSWASLSTGGLTGVTAGTRLTGGGTSGNVTLALDTTTINEITANTAKTGITTGQASAITTNTAKVGITTGQASAITANTAKNSYPSADASKLAGIDTNANNYTHPSSHAISFITGLTAALAGKTTESYVDTAIANLIDSAPGALDTLNELAASLGDDDDFAGTMTTALAGKSPTAGNTSLTTLGTIATGVWQGTAIDQAYLTGVSGTNTGDEPDGSVSVKGILELATTTETIGGTDTTRAVTPAGIAARSHKAVIGDGSSVSIAVSHSLNTRDVIVQMYDASTYDTVISEVVRTSTSVVTCSFKTAPATNDIIVLITKVA